MSRSRRKPYITDQNRGKPQHGVAKRLANRAVRHANKRGIESPEQAPVSGKAYRKESNSWDIRDWAFHDPKNPKATRK